MADMAAPANRHSGKRKAWHPLKVDMTPMVDLGFLLITFFIFTTSMMEPRVTKLIVPADGDSTPAAESKVLTVLLASHNQVFVYEGKWEDAVAKGAVLKTNYDLSLGVGKRIREKQKMVAVKWSRDEMLLIIKPLKGSSYGNFIDMLDEAKINDVIRYVVVDPAKEEERYVERVNR